MRRIARPPGTVAHPGSPSKPRWTSASYLLYLGAFTILAASAAAYAYLSSRYGDGASVSRGF